MVSLSYGSFGCKKQKPTLDTSSTRGFIIQQHLIKFKRGRTVKPRGKLTWELKSLQEQRSFSLGLHVPLSMVFCFPCLVHPSVRTGCLCVLPHRGHQWLSWSLI